MSIVNTPAGSPSEPRFLSIRTKLVGFVSLIIIAICSTLSMYFITQRAGANESFLLETGTILAKNLAHNDQFRYAVFIENPEMLRPFIDSVLEVDEVVYVVVTGPAGKVLAEKRKGRVYPDPAFARAAAGAVSESPLITPFVVAGERSRETRITRGKGGAVFLPAAEEGHYDFSVPIIRRSLSDRSVPPFTFEAPVPRALPKVYGVVQVGMTKAKMQAVLNALAGKAALFTALIILCGIALTVLLARRIVTPLKSLAEVADRIAQGDLTASVAPSTHDEVGQLTTVFNRMTGSLQERDLAISTHIQTITTQVKELNSLNRISATITSTLELEKLLATVLDQLIESVGFSKARLVLYDSDRRVAYGSRMAGVPYEVEREWRDVEVPVREDGGLLAELLLHGQPVLIEDVDTVAHRLAPFNLDPARRLGISSYVCAPLKSKERVLGYVAAARGAQRCTQDDLDLLVTIASQVAIAIDNASVYRQVEELNIGLEAKVRERTAALERFLARVSHDLRTPLTSMTGFAENMLAGMTGPLTEKQRLYLARIIANGCRLGRLVDDLLDLLLDPDQVELSFREVNLPSLAVDVVEQLRPLTITKQQRLEVQCTEKNLVVWADADKLHRVMTNLVDNAIKYTGSGRAVLVKVETEGPLFAKVTVRDTGEGISAEALPKIFDSSFRVSRPEGKQVISHRLGLSIVKDLVKRHGGRVTVHSEVGRGSEFTFTIPIRRALERKQTAFVPGTKRLLVADDDPDIRQLLSDRLTSDGYVVQTASDGCEALAALRSEKFDGLILDIGMPTVNGIEVLHTIREEQPALPVIMITAAEARTRALGAIQAGAQAYLLKPFDAAQLKEIVERWVGPGMSEHT